MSDVLTRRWAAPFVLGRFVIIAAALALVLVASRASAGNVPSTTTYGATIYALMAADLGGLGASATSVEVVDAGSMTHIRTLPLGNRAATSLAVSPDEQRLYVADSFAGGVAVLNSSDGSTITDIKLPARDLVLSADGSRLYATAASSIVAIDTSTNTVIDTKPTGTDIPLGIALSPDGSVLAAASTGDAFYIASPSNVAGAVRVSISNTCGPDHGDVTFNGSGRALLWDNGCDDLYQVDIPGQAQVPADTVHMADDSGASFNYNNALSYSSVSGRAYVHKESEELAVIDPAAVSGSAQGGFSGVPFIAGLTPSGKDLLVAVIHRFSGGGADTLDQLDTPTGIFTRDVYTFTVATQSVRDMRIIGRPVLRQGDVDCSGSVDSIDALKVLRHNAALSVAQNDPCPGVGGLNPKFGDIDCSDAVSSIDALKLLRHNAALSVTQTEPCPNITEQLN
jgi:YVTN family beta-propeller protein